VNTSAWIGRFGGLGAFGVLAMYAPVLLEIVVCAYVVLFIVTVLVSSLHSDEKYRADARKVLDRLIGYGRHGKPERVPDNNHQLPPSLTTTQQQSDGGERLPEQVASAGQIARARLRPHG
jgi:hypothetical protein